MKKLVALLLTFLLVLTGCTITKIEDDIETDSIKFSKDYPVVKEDNLFEYVTYDRVIEIISSGTGIVYLGYPECKLCDEVVPLLNDVAKENNIDKIYYYNYKDIKDNETPEYEKIVSILSPYLKDEKILEPVIIFVKDGKIIDLKNGLDEQYLTEEGTILEDKKTLISQDYSVLMKQLNTSDASNS